MDPTFEPTTHYWQQVAQPEPSPVFAALRQQLMGNALPPTTPAYAPGGSFVSHAMGLYRASAPQAPQGDTPIPWHELPASSLVQQIPHYLSPQRLLATPASAPAATQPSQHSPWPNGVPSPRPDNGTWA